MYTNENVFFAQLLKETRKKRKISMKKLANGLCSASMISKIESAERYPDKLLRDRLLERMGVAGYDYENFLNADEYGEWKSRQDIVWAIIDGNKESAMSILDDLLDKNDMSNAILRQFYFAMLLQIKKAKWNIELVDMSAKLRLDMELDCIQMVKEALSATIVNPDTATEDTCLCIQEINLLLEYWKMSNVFEEKVIQFEKLGNYLLEQNFDEISIAELYPKIVYYIYAEKIKKSQVSNSDYQYMLRLLNKAIQILSSARRGYYLWEILLARRDIYERMIVLLEKEGYVAYSRRETLKKLEVENEKLLEALEYSYGIADVEKQMTEDVYLYIEYNVACIADVIRQRRQTSGMSMRELAEGVCNLETLEDIEHKRTNPHMATVQELFKKLNLSTELKRAEVVADNPQAVHIVREIRYFMNCCEYDKAEICIDELKKIVSLDIPINKQFLCRCQSFILWKKGKITKNVYLSRLKKALEYTIPCVTVLKMDEVYLTKEEIKCIENFVSHLPNRKKKVFVDFVERYCNHMENTNANCTYISHYRTILTNVANEMGNLGSYEKSNEMSYKVLKMCMKTKMVFLVENNIYNILWNLEMMKKSNIRQKEEIIRYCLELAKFCKDKYSISFYEKKLS